MKVLDGSCGSAKGVQQQTFMYRGTAVRRHVSLLTKKREEHT